MVNDLVGGQLCDMAYIVPMHVKPKFTYLLIFQCVGKMFYVKFQRSQGNPMSVIHFPRDSMLYLVLAMIDMIFGNHTLKYLLE